MGLAFLAIMTRSKTKVGEWTVILMVFFLSLS